MNFVFSSRCYQFEVTEVDCRHTTLKLEIPKHFIRPRLSFWKWMIPSPVQHSILVLNYYYNHWQCITLKLKHQKQYSISRPSTFKATWAIWALLHFHFTVSHHHMISNFCSCIEWPANWLIIVSTGIVSRISLSDANTINEENQSSIIVVRKRFLMSRTRLIALSALLLVIASETSILYMTFSVGNPDNSCNALSGLMKLSSAHLCNVAGLLSLFRSSLSSS